MERLKLVVCVYIYIQEFEGRQRVTMKLGQKKEKLWLACYKWALTGGL